MLLPRTMSRVAEFYSCSLANEVDPSLRADALLILAAEPLGVDAMPADVAGLNIPHGVGPVGLEPTTYGLKVRCSTN